MTKRQAASSQLIDNLAAMVVARIHTQKVLKLCGLKSWDGIVHLSPQLISKVSSYYAAIALHCRTAPSCTEICDYIALQCRMKVYFILTKSAEVVWIKKLGWHSALIYITTTYFQGQFILRRNCLALPHCTILHRNCDYIALQCSMKV